MTSEPTFPCTQCGACCKALLMVETSLPHDEVGRCDYLIDTVTPEGKPISVCSVYETREEVGCHKLNKVKPKGMPWADYYSFMVRACGLMQEKYGIDESYRPEIDSTLSDDLNKMGT